MTEEHIYPLLFKPVLKDYIWGGRNLERLYGRDLPAGIIAESWEISGHADGTTAVTNGYFAGLPLTTVQNALKLKLVGSKNAWAQERGKFPLLVKLLDANRSLSVQVHPDDIYALEHEGNELGKTEMWFVLHAAPEAALILGLRPHTTAELLQRAIVAGNLEHYLHRLPIKAGDAICVPAGTVHAILEGAVIAEIQQNSNTTYRVYDWNRLGANGEPRPLHVNKAIDVIDFTRVEPGVARPEMVYEKNGVSRYLLCSNSYFTTERVELESGAVYNGRCDGSTLEIWGIIRGAARIAGLSLSPIQFTLLPASLGDFSVMAASKSTLLRSFVS